MNKSPKHIAPFLLVATIMLAVGCNNGSEPAWQGTPIEFGTSLLDVSTRVGADQEGVDGGTVPVFVTGRKDNQNFYPISTSATGERIVENDATAKWLPQNANNVRQWEAASNYVFNGYAYHPSSATSSGGGLTISSKGLQIVVQQPTSYQPEKMVDYLYSRTFTTSGAARPLVQLDLEHAMSLVEIRIVKHESIESAYLKSLTIDNLFTQATMNCTPTPYGDANPNSWKIALSGTNDTDYSIEGGDPTDDTPATPHLPMVNRGEDGQVMMNILAVPQQLSAANTIRVSYWVNERYSATSPDNYVLHEATFVLNNYTPYVWAPGHRIVYTLEVDTGIHLQGVIKPWVEVDYIEGTVLPNI